MRSDQFTMILLIAIAGAALVFLGMVVTAVFWMPALMKGAGALASLSRSFRKLRTPTFRRIRDASQQPVPLCSSASPWFPPSQPVPPAPKRL